MFVDCCETRGEFQTLCMANQDHARDADVVRFGTRLRVASG